MRGRTHGFSLVELMVSLAVVSGVLVGAWASFNSFVRMTQDTISATEREEDVTITLKVLARDIRVSGFGVPQEMRAAAENGTASSVGVDIAENDSAVEMDINGDGDKGDTIFTDRVFVADGIRLLRDSTNGNDEDTELTETADPATGIWLPLAGIIAERMGSDDMTGGYYATLGADLAVGATSLSLLPSDLDINVEAQTNIGTFRDASWDTVDFAAQSAVILAGGQTSNNTDFNIEGHRTGNSRTGLAASSATMAADTVLSNYRAGRTKVVPGVAWYIDKKTNDEVYWLYRNNDKVLADALDFQVRYGFDRVGDGLEWADHIPPQRANEIDSAERAEIYSELSSGSADKKEIVQALKAVQIKLRVRKAKGTVALYEATVRFRN